MPKSISGPSGNINRTLDDATHDVEEYVNELKALPDDFANTHLENLKKSLKRAGDALVTYEFKKDPENIDFDNNLSKLDNAINFLVNKKNQEENKSKKNINHLNLSEEIVVALNAINYLVGLLRNVQEERPFKGVLVTDKSYKRGRKIEGVTGEEFEKQ